MSLDYKEIEGRQHLSRLAALIPQGEERPITIDVEPVLQEPERCIVGVKPEMRTALETDEARRMHLAKLSTLSRGLSDLHYRLSIVRQYGGEGLELQRQIERAEEDVKHLRLGGSTMTAVR